MLIFFPMFILNESVCVYLANIMLEMLEPACRSNILVYFFKVVFLNVIEKH